MDLYSCMRAWTCDSLSSQLRGACDVISDHAGVSRDLNIELVADVTYVS
jgi:hypothetical protein